MVYLKWVEKKTILSTIGTYKLVYSQPLRLKEVR